MDAWDIISKTDIAKAVIFPEMDSSKESSNISNLLKQFEMLEDSCILNIMQSVKQFRDLLNIQERGKTKELFIESIRNDLDALPPDMDNNNNKGDEEILEQLVDKLKHKK